MKNKVIILLISVLFVVIIMGCVPSKPDNKTVDKVKDVEKEKETYIKYVQKLKKVEISTEDLKYDVNVTYDKLDEEEIRYQVVIDNPQVNMEDVKVLAIHNKQTDDIFPSIGIFDDTTNLTVGDEQSGIILVGYIPYEGNIKDFECEMKVLISYKLEENKITDYFVTKK